MKIRIYLKSFSKDAINQGMEVLTGLLSPLKGLNFSAVSLPTRIKKFCVLRSPHVNKDSREQFEVRIFKRFLDITISDMQQLALIFENFQIPSGVACFFTILEKN